MDKETLELITEQANTSGYFERKADEFDKFINALLNCSTLTYDKKRLCIDNECFTALLKAYACDAVESRIKTLNEARNAGEEE